jgi:hypothetical protein
MKWLVLVFLLVVAACGGPSTAEVKSAKTAQYTASPQALYDVAVQVAQQDYKIGRNDPATLVFATEEQMYSANGGRQSAGAGGVIQYSEGSVVLSLVVEVVKTERGHAVVVTPKTFQVVAGSPQPRELAPDDPNLPGWVSGRVDALAVGIYEAAKSHVAR